MVTHRLGTIMNTINKMFGEKMDDIFEDVLGFLKGLYNKNQSELISKSSRPLTLVEETGFLI